MTDKALEAALKECPFCGGEAHIVKRDVEPQGDPWYGKKNELFVECPKCSACIFDGYWHEGFLEDAQAIVAWNRRAPLSALPGEAEVVAWRGRYAHPGEEPEAWSLYHHERRIHPDFECEPLVTLASLQAMQARAEKAERERDEASREMRGLLNSFVREHFPDNTEWRPLDDLVGMITQMDNACTVARDYLSRAEAAEARVKELEEERDALRSRIEEQRVNFAGLQAVQDALNLILPPAKGGSNG